MYRVTAAGTSGNAMVEYVTADGRVSSANIPDTVTINGITYKVTSIAANAFAGNRSLKKVKIGKNIARIGARAFFGCRNLKSITIRTTKLSAKKIGAKAFSNTHKKAKVKVPGKALKSYRKILKKKGLSAKAKIG